MGEISFVSVTNAWMDAVVRVCIGGTVALCLAFVLTLILKRAQPNVRSWTLRLALLKVIVAFFSFTAIPLAVLPAQPEAAQTGTASIAETPTPSPSASGLQTVDAPSTPAPGGGNTLIGAAMGVLPMLWGAGAVFGLLRIGRHYREARALMQSACPVTDPSIHAGLIRACKDMGLSYIPGFCVSDLTDVPLLYGLMRPVIVLPSAVVTDFTDHECHMMLAHELAHIKRNDLAWSVIAGLAQILFFFHPLVWWAHRELRMVQEICCDEMAIRSADVSAHSYGEVLVRVAARQTTPSQDGLIAVAMAESFKTIQRRLEEMQTFRLSTGWTRWAPMMVIVIGGVALMPWRLEAQNGSRQGDSRSVKAGNYSLKIVDLNSSGNFNTGGNKGFSFSSGGGSSFSSSFSGGTGGSFGPNGATTSNSFKSNLSLGLDISGRSKEDLLLITGVENLHGQDDRGRAVKGPEMPSMMIPNMPFPGNQQNDGSRREMLNLQTEEGARRLKTLEGDLMVANGAVRTITFAAGEVQPGASKTAGRVTITIESVHESDNGYELSIKAITPQPDQAKNIQDHMKMMMQGNRSMEVEMIGTDGVAYKPNTSAGGSSSGGGFATGTGAGSFSFSSGTGNNSDPNVSVINQNVGFMRPQNGSQPRSLVFRVIERQGETRRIPFKFTDVTLSDKR